MCAASAPKSSAAQRQQRDLEFRVRQLLTVECGVHDPEVLRVEQESDRVIVLFTVEGLTGRVARTAFITPTDDPWGSPEVVVTHSFTF